MTLQERIRFIQKKLGLTQKELAKGLQVPPGSISEWYNSGLIPRADKLQLLVDIYKVNPDFLLRNCGEPFLAKQLKWTKKDEKRLNNKYKHIMFLANHCGKSDLVKGFYDILDVKNWKEALDQKLGKAIFGNLQSLTSSLKISPNILLVEFYAELFFDFLRCLSLNKTLTPKHLYILAMVCEYDSEDFHLIIPKNPFSKFSIETLHSHLDYASRTMFKIYGLKDFSKDSKSSNTAWQGIRLAFLQLDDIFRYQEIPHLCEINDHQFFYWKKCPLCDGKIKKAVRSFDEEFSENI